MKRFWIATRPYSFPAAVVPVLIGTAVAKLIFPEIAIHWLHLVLVLIGSIGTQAISNMINDIVDYDTGLDNPDNWGKMNAIVNGTVTRGEMLRETLVVSALSLAIAAYLVYATTMMVLWIVLASIFIAVFYTAPPLKLKYHALGDVAVLLGFGTAIVFGAYVVQAYTQPSYLDGPALLKLAAYALPSAMLVVAILHVNNHRDRKNDLEFGAKTLANRLSESASKSFIYFLIVGAYVFAIGAAIAGVTTWWMVAIALSIPPLMKLLSEIKQDHYEGMTVPMVAQLHGMFGILTTVAIILRITTGMG